MEALLLVFISILIFLNIYKKDILNLISPLFLISILFMFLYIVQIIFFDSIYFSFGWVELYGSSKQLFLMLIFLSLLAFTLGYKVRHKVILKKIENYILYKKIEKYSIFIGLLGLALYLYFIMKTGLSTYYSGHHGNADFSVGAQFYYMSYFIFTALALLINVHLYAKLSWSGKMFFLFFLFFLIVDATLRQQRGSWIRIIVIFMISYIIFLYKSGRLSRQNFFTNIKRYYSLILFGTTGSVVVVSMVVLRQVDGNMVELLNIIINQPELLFVGSGVSIGNEYVTAYNAFIAFISVPLPDYGLKWIVPITNFIPSSIWEDKPYWHSFSTSVFDYIDKYSLVAHAAGSAETGLIDAFYRFYWLSPIFFFFLGWLSKLFFLKAIYGDIKDIILYICYYVGLLYFITQNMFPFIVFGVFMYIPVGFYFFLKRIRIKR